LSNQILKFQQIITRNPTSPLDSNESNDKNSRFYHFEDTLLLIGLRKFGLGSWEAINSNLIPSKTAKQIQNRYKNLSSRRASKNPIKVFYAINNRIFMMS
jgi:hypothetical protein